MKRWVGALLGIGLTCTSLPQKSTAANNTATDKGRAQLTVTNPQHLYVPEDQATVLLQVTCRKLRQEFRLRRSFENSIRLTLVLGEPNERVEFAPVGENSRISSTESSHAPTIYMRQWDEGKFVKATLRVAVWKIVTDMDEVRLVQDILGQAAWMVPVPIQTLRKKH